MSIYPIPGMYKIIDGKKLALEHELRLKEKIEKLKVQPSVVSILVGDNPGSLLYTGIKQGKARQLGINFAVWKFPENVAFAKVTSEIDEFNNDVSIHGIMVQLPLPERFLPKEKVQKLLDRINPQKDVDGLTGKGPLLPATVRGVLSILESEKQLDKGKTVVVVGGVRGLLGRALVKSLKDMKEKVIPVSRDDESLGEFTKKADVLISSSGTKNLITEEMVKKRAVVVDVGGDVDFRNVSRVAGRITPPKGGVGPMTVISLMENAVDLATKS